MTYDVFISFKNTAPDGGLTADREIAERLHSMLRDEGLEVFFSEKDLSNAAFMDEIYTALEQANLLILVASDLDYIHSRWVKSEWSTFFGSIQSGRKPKASIMTVLRGVSTREIPIQLEHFESFGFDDLDNAVDFAFKTLRRVKNSEVIARMAIEEEQRRKEAELEAMRETRKRMEAELADRLKAQEAQEIADRSLSVSLQLREDEEYDPNDSERYAPHSSARAAMTRGVGKRGGTLPGHTHDYEYTRQESDEYEEVASSAVRDRVSAELQTPIPDTPDYAEGARVSLSSRMANLQERKRRSAAGGEEPEYIHEIDETEDAAAVELLRRMLDDAE